MLLVTKLNLHHTRYLSVYKGQPLHYKPGQLVWAEEPKGGVCPWNEGRIGLFDSEKRLKVSAATGEDRAFRAIKSLFSGEQIFLRARDMCLTAISKAAQAVQCLVGPVPLVTPALQSKTNLPSPNWDAGALSAASGPSLSQGRAFKTSFIQIFTNCY